MTTAALTSNLDRSMAYQFTDYWLLFTDAGQWLKFARWSM